MAEVEFKKRGMDDILRQDRYERALRELEKTRRLSVISRTSLALAVAGSLVAIGASVLSEKLISVGGQPPLDRKGRMERTIEEQSRRLADLEARVARLSLPATGPQPLTNTLPPDIARRISSIEQAQSQMGSVILATPEKALSLPMLRRDVADLKSSQEDTQEQLQREIDRIYDLNKWIIGGLGTGVLSLALNQVVRRRAKSTIPEESKESSN